MRKPTFLGVLEDRVMTRLKQHLDAELEKLALHECSVEDFQSFEGRGEHINIQRVRMTGELAHPALMIDFEWKLENTGLGIKQWTLFVDEFRRDRAFGARALIMISENDEARVDWTVKSGLLPGVGPLIFSDLKLNIGQTEERADWFLSLAIGLGLEPYSYELDGTWEGYYERYKPKGQEVMYNWVKYRSQTVARWAVFLDHLGIEFSDDSYRPYDLGDGVRGTTDFHISAWDLRIDVHEEAPTEEVQEIARRLSNGSQRVLVTFGEMNTNGWLFRNGERKMGNFTILDCRRCDRVVLCCHHEAPTGERWSWDLLGEPGWCDEENCVKNFLPLLLPLLNSDWVKRIIKRPKPSGKMGYSDQKPGLYDNVKAALTAAKRERFGVHE